MTIRSHVNSRSKLLAAGALATTAAALFAVLSGWTAPAEAQSTGAGQKAPTFTAETTDGVKIDLAKSYADKLVLIDFWATWCPPCRAEVPHLVEANLRYKSRGLAILSLSLDAGRRISQQRVETYAKENGMNWTHVYTGTEEIAGSYGVRGIPAAFLVDGDTGLIVAAGRELRGQALLTTIDKAVKKKEDERKQKEQKP